MSTSIHESIVLFASSLHSSDHDPVDVTISRDGIANGLLHAADSMAQVRVNIMHADASTFGGTGDEYIVPAVEQDEYASNGADIWYPMQGSPFGEWPLTIHADGTPYLCRVRVGGSAEGNGATGNEVKFRVVLAPNADIARAELLSPSDNVFETTGTTATSAAWLTGITQGTEGAETYMIVTAAKAAAWTRDVSVYDAVSSGTPRQIQQCLVAAHVFCISDSADPDDRPVLHALTIAEYVGL